VSLQPMPTAIRERIFDGHNHQALNVPDWRWNDGLWGRWGKWTARGAPRVRAVRIAAHHRTRRGAGHHVCESRRHRQQRMVSTDHGV